MRILKQGGRVTKGQLVVIAGVSNRSSSAVSVCLPSVSSRRSKKAAWAARTTGDAVCEQPSPAAGSR